MFTDSTCNSLQSTRWNSQWTNQFCKAFLLKTTIYHAKEAIQQGLKAYKVIVFIPSTAFTAQLYTVVDLIWQSPDQPSGVSLFFVQKHLCMLCFTQEYRQNRYTEGLQTNIGSTTHTLLLFGCSKTWEQMSLYFGNNSLTSLCISSWINHFEHNRVY